MQREKTDRKRLLTKAERGIRRTNAEKERGRERVHTNAHREKEVAHCRHRERERLRSNAHTRRREVQRLRRRELDAPVRGDRQELRRNTATNAERKIRRHF